MGVLGIAGSEEAMMVTEAERSDSPTMLTADILNLYAKPGSTVVNV